MGTQTNNHFYDIYLLSNSYNPITNYPITFLGAPLIILLPIAYPAGFLATAIADHRPYRRTSVAAARHALPHAASFGAYEPVEWVPPMHEQYISKEGQ